MQESIVEAQQKPLALNIPSSAMLGSQTSFFWSCSKKCDVIKAKIEFWNGLNANLELKTTNKTILAFCLIRISFHHSTLLESFFFLSLTLSLSLSLPFFLCLFLSFCLFLGSLPFLFILICRFVNQTLLQTEDKH